MSKILVTGATGFVGAALAAQLAARGHTVIAAVRRPRKSSISTEIEKVVGDIGPETDWSAALDGVDTVIHTAGRAHVMRPGPDEEQLSRRVNLEATSRLLAACAKADIGRFVHFSTVGVYDPAVGTAASVTEANACAPATVYGRTKLAAEQEVTRFGHETGAMTLILRPPLIYGPGAPGNWARLVWLARLPVPLPLGAIDNRRTLLGLRNLGDAVTRLVEMPAAPARSGVYNVTDGEDVSTTDIVAAIRRGLGRRPALVPVPASLMGGAFRVMGRGDEFRKFAGALMIDGSKFAGTFSWQPPERTLAGVTAAAAAELPA